LSHGCHQHTVGLDALGSHGRDWLSATRGFDCGIPCISDSHRSAAVVLKALLHLFCRHGDVVTDSIIVCHGQIFLAFENLFLSPKLRQCSNLGGTKFVERDSRGRETMHRTHHLSSEWRHRCQSGSAQDPIMQRACVMLCISACDLHSFLQTMNASFCLHVDL